MTIQSPQKISSPGKSVYTKKRKSVPSLQTLHTETNHLPPKPTLDILPAKVQFHNLLPLSIRVNRAQHALRPLKRAFIALLRLLADETDQVARHVGALTFDVAEVLFDAAA